MSERTLNELSNSLKSKVHIYLKDRKTAMQFLIDAENEGYKIGNKKPTECDTDNIISLDNNKLSYVGLCGRVCFQCNGGSGYEGVYHRVDYSKYKRGDSDYYFNSKEYEHYD